jgi:hypothetical protein
MSVQIHKRPTAIDEFVPQAREGRTASCVEMSLSAAFLRKDVGQADLEEDESKIIQSCMVTF